MEQHALLRRAKTNVGSSLIAAETWLALPGWADVRLRRLFVDGRKHAPFMTAGAHDFGLVADSFAVGAAELFLVGWNAIAGGVSAFSDIGHSFPPGFDHGRPF
jgi:hypothetical protein